MRKSAWLLNRAGAWNPGACIALVKIGVFECRSRPFQCSNPELPSSIECVGSKKFQRLSQCAELLSAMLRLLRIETEHTNMAFHRSAPASQFALSWVHQSQNVRTCSMPPSVDSIRLLLHSRTSCENHDIGTLMSLGWRPCAFSNYETQRAHQHANVIA